MTSQVWGLLTQRGLLYLPGAAGHCLQQWSVWGQGHSPWGKDAISGAGTLLWGRDTPTRHRGAPVPPCPCGGEQPPGRPPRHLPHHLQARGTHEHPGQEISPRLCHVPCAKGWPEPGGVGQSPGRQSRGSSVTRGAPGGRAEFARSQPVLASPEATAGTGRGRLEPGQAAFEELTCRLAAGVGSY